MNTVERLAQSLQKSGLGPHPNTDLNHIGVGLIRELAKGEPLDAPALEAVNEALGGDEATVSRILMGLTERDEEGRIVGVAGLTLAPTKHRYIVGDKTLYTWCTLDGLYMASILGQTGRIETRCPATDISIEVTVHPDGTGTVNPSGVVMSMTVPEQIFGPRPVSDTRASFCNFVHFLASQEALEQWKPDNIEVEAISMDDGFALGLLIGQGFCNP